MKLLEILKMIDIKMHWQVCLVSFLTRKQDREQEEMKI